VTALCLLIALLAPTSAPTTPASAPVAPPTVRLPHYSAQTPSGARITLRKAYRGKPLVVHLWATWCVPCLDELHTYNTLMAPWQKQGGAVVSLSLDATLGALRTFLDERDIEGTVLWDGSGEVSLSFGVDQVPSTFIYDREGVRIYARVGPLDPTDPALTAALKRALQP
jgi:peroxiredoxin